MKITKLLLMSTVFLSFSGSSFAASPEEMEIKMKELENRLAKFENMMGNVDQYIEERVEQRVEEELNKISKDETDDIEKTILQKIEKRVENQIDETISSISPAAGSSGSKFGKGYIDIPGTDSAIKFGGYAKLDATYDIGKAYGNDFVSFGGIPLDSSTNDNQDGEFNMTARQTRLNLTTMTETGLGDLKVFLEGDFFESQGAQNTTNRHGFGLRHAYGQLGNWLVGQAWTNFQDMGVYPGSLDLIGGVGTTHIRQPQIKYTANLSDQNTLAASVENPSGDINDSTGTEANVMEQIPDAVLAFTHKDDWGHASLRGVGRQIHVQNNVTGSDDDELGWGLSASGKFSLSESTSLFGRYAYGDGIGRYLFDAVASSGAYSRDHLETQVAYGGHATLRHNWTNNLNSNLIAGHVEIDNETSVVGTAVNKSIYSAHANLIWNPVPKVKVGIEYMHGERELENGSDGDLDRILTSFIYKF